MNVYLQFRTDKERSLREAQPVPIVDLAKMLINIDSGNEWQSIDKYFAINHKDWRKKRPSVVFTQVQFSSIVEKSQRMWPNIPDDHGMAYFKLFVTISTPSSSKEFLAKFRSEDDVNGYKVRSAKLMKEEFSQKPESQATVDAFNEGVQLGRRSAAQRGRFIEEQWYISSN